MMFPQNLIRDVLKENKKVLSYPVWLEESLVYEVVSGSVSQGSSTNFSDIDLVGICVPPKEIMFPYFLGQIPGFDPPSNSFQSAQYFHQKRDGFDTEYDITVYSLPTYMKLCMGGNPNLLDTLFCHSTYLLSSNHIGNTLRDERYLFLSKGLYTPYVGYMRAQLNRAKSGKTSLKRKHLVDQFGYDTKFVGHMVRLCENITQILSTNDLVLESSGGIVKQVREGKWSFEQVEQYFTSKEYELKKLFDGSSLPDRVDKAKVKQLLVHLLERVDINYIGSPETLATSAISEIQKVLQSYGY